MDGSNNSVGVGPTSTSRVQNFLKLINGEYVIIIRIKKSETSGVENGGG